MAGLQLQMSWKNSLLLTKRKIGPPLGFRNVGNTCYLNAVLQCLTYTPPLANFCLRHQHSTFCDSPPQHDKKSSCPFCLLEMRIIRSLSKNLTLDTPGKIIGGLKLFAEHFSFGRQEDAHEFLRYVIDACHTSSLRLKKFPHQKGKFVGDDSISGSSVIKEIFGGALQSQVKCLACGNESNKVDEIMDISVDIVNSSSLKEGFQKFFQPERLDGNNKYQCESCKTLVAARKQMSILQAPNILVIQLKRFDGIYGGKINKAISFEEVLDLSNFMCKTSQDINPKYNLFATIVHSGGSPDSGHYYAYIKDLIGRWYCCNDSNVSVSSLEEVFSENVYILFFSRTKQRPVLPKKHPSTNGTKSHNCNGNGTLKVVKSSQQKSTDSQQPKIGEYLYVPLKKPVSFGFAGPKKSPISCNKENNGNNGEAKGLDSKKASDKKIPLLEKNGSSQNKHIASNLSDESDSQRKHEELTESLKKEASAFLRNCGYSDEVASFMRAKKLSMRDECNNGLQRKELKRKLIDDAKASLIPQIPGSLKAELVKRIRSHIA